MTKDEFIFKEMQKKGAWPDRCWHEFMIPNPKGGNVCIHCNKKIDHFPFVPDFATWPGFGMLLEGMQGHERWVEFKIEYGGISKYGHDLDLLLEDIINPLKFRDIIFWWLGGEEEHMGELTKFEKAITDNIAAPLKKHLEEAQVHHLKHHSDYEAAEHKIAEQEENITFWKRQVDNEIEANRRAEARIQELTLQQTVPLSDHKAICAGYEVRIKELESEKVKREEMNGLVVATIDRLEKEKEELESLLQAAISEIPTNWLDPLLTGPDAVIGKYPYDCPDVERLLSAIKNRIIQQIGKDGGK